VRDLRLIERDFINFNIVCRSLLNDLNTEKNVVFAILTAALLIIGFSSNMGNQFLSSVYSQEDDDSEDSAPEDQITTLVPLDNFTTNQTAPGLNVTQSDEQVLPEDTSVAPGTSDEETQGSEDAEDQGATDAPAEESLSGDSTGAETNDDEDSVLTGSLDNDTGNQTLGDFNTTVPDEATSPEDGSTTTGLTGDELVNEGTADTDNTTTGDIEDENQTDIPIGPEELADNSTPDVNESTDQESLAPENFSETDTDLSPAANLDNLTPAPENLTSQPNNLSGAEIQETLESSSEQMQNESDAAPVTGGENATTSSPANFTGANETSISASLSPAGVDLLGDNLNVTEDQPLAPTQDVSDNETTEDTTTPSATNASAQSGEVDTLAPIVPTEDTFDNATSQEIEAASSSVAGVTTATSTVENNLVSNIQNIINNIAIGGAQSGGDSKQIASQIAKDIAANPKGPVAKAVQTLAGEYTKGNSDEVNIAAKQIGTLVAEGNNIQQTLVQVTNKVVNNIKNIKTTIENYDKVIVNPKISSNDKTVIEQTINVIKKSKTEVDVPRVHIKFHTHERNLVLRILSTNNYKYEMPFSKYNGAFKLDDDEFRVKVLSGDGSVQSASVAKMFKSGKIGDREFLDKDVRNGKVFFSLDDVSDGKYLLEVYVKLSNGSIGTFARGSVSID
jgi:hypothetical protein